MAPNQLSRKKETFNFFEKCFEITNLFKELLLQLLEV